MKPAVTRALLTVSLGWMALSVWWPLWFLFFGALTPADELAATIGPALHDGAAQAVRWQLLPSWVAYPAALGGTAPGYPCVFCHVLEQLHPGVSPAPGAAPLLYPCGLGLVPVTVSWPPDLYEPVHDPDAAAFSGYDGTQLSGTQ